jgi:hypothetical protein
MNRLSMWLAVCGFPGNIPSGLPLSPGANGSGPNSLLNQFSVSLVLNATVSFGASSRFAMKCWPLEAQANSLRRLENPNSLWLEGE